MDKHLLTEIEIKDFKCFKDFKAEGFKRVNLIGGKNNVGKTAFMEAVCINVYSDNIPLITHALMSPKLLREQLEIGFRRITKEEEKYFLESIKSFDSISNINDIKFNIKEKDGIKEYIFNHNNKISNVNINDFSYERTRKKSIKFLGQLGFMKVQLKEIFESVQEKDKEDTLYKFINEFDKNIVNFKIIGGDKPQCKTNNGEYRDINEFGDGLKHYISIICALYACADGYLFIDEIDNGIHWTQLDRLWEIILAVSKEQKVQLFATTHSKECIESYARASKKLEDKDKDICYIKMSRLNDGSIKAGVRDYDMMQDSLEEQHELRGW